MKTIGIICEYNPFHNGHLFHINAIKKLYPNSIIVLVMSGNFLQRGDVSLINKWDKTKIALSFGINLVVELPFHFSSQSADIFAYGAMKILNELKVDKIVFGSECNDIKLLNSLADIQLNNNEYNEKIKEYLDKGVNYPTALSRALKDITNKTVTTPNDILGLSYIKEIKKNNHKITPVSIKRKNNYHSKILNDRMSSATSIREAIKNYIDISSYVPNITMQYINKDLSIDNYFPLLKYKIISEIDNIDRYQTVDEGIENRIKKVIYNCENMEDLIKKIKTKRYTYNKIKRMLTHILCGFTKEEAKKYQDKIYIRILGFDETGKLYLNQIKKEITIPVISNYSSSKGLLNLEFRVNAIYASVLKEEQQFILTEMEYKSTPVIKQDIKKNI